MVLASFQSVVSGESLSFWEKYGERAERINLCRFHVSAEAVRQMSDVFGSPLVRREVIWAANGWRGSVLFE